MTTECTTERLEFGGLRRQRVVGRFDGGELGSDGGGLLLRELAQRTGLFGRLSACFRDYREPQRTRHPVEVLVAARVLGLALGYEDLNDHDTLRQSKLWSLLCGAAGRGRRRTSWEALPPGKSTLNRMELTGPALDAGERYKKIVADTAQLDALLVDLFLDWHGEQPERIVLDVDATDDPLHGRQEGRFFHGYYRSYCYLPLYIFCGQQLLGARLRTADRDAADGTVEELERIVGRIRKRWPGVEIWLRGDSGFCRDQLLAWCEAQGVEYVLGIAQNPRLKRSLAPEMERARQECERTGQAARVFKDFRYRTLDSWSRERRVIGKAEHLPRGANPRFVVTSLGAGADGGARALRGGVLRAGRYGEPHQGTAAGAVRRSHLGADDAGQPVAPVLRLLRLHAAGVAAALGLGRHPAGAGAMRHDPPQVAQDRRADPGQRTSRTPVVR